MAKENKFEVAIVDFKVVERTSKAGNDYKCIIAIDEKGKEYFVTYVN